MRRKNTRTDTPLCASMGLLSGLEAQGEISELLDELHGDGLERVMDSARSQLPPY